MTAPQPSDQLAYADNYISVLFKVGEEQIAFDLQNITDSGIKINWDELSLVYPDGSAKRVIHNGIILKDRDKPQAVTVIPPGSKISDILLPTDNIDWSDIYIGWKYSPLFGGNDRLVWNDKEFSIYFPIEIKGEKKEYRFSFKIKVSLAAPASTQGTH